MSPIGPLIFQVFFLSLSRSTEWFHSHPLGKWTWLDNKIHLEISLIYLYFFFHFIMKMLKSVYLSPPPSPAVISCHLHLFDLCTLSSPPPLVIFSLLPIYFLVSLSLISLPLYFSCYSLDTTTQLFIIAQPTAPPLPQLLLILSLSLSLSHISMNIITVLEICGMKKIQSNLWPTHTRYAISANGYLNMSTEYLTIMSVFLQTPPPGYISEDGENTDNQGMDGVDLSPSPPIGNLLNFFFFFSISLSHSFPSAAKDLTCSPFFLQSRCDFSLWKLSHKHMCFLSAEPRHKPLCFCSCTCTRPIGWGIFSFFFFSFFFFSSFFSFFFLFFFLPPLRHVV
ncbi:SMAD3 [Acanthosepion pharaonis]|uniref:SMAD3 n=1 Tax=Acanthosepion pharaonis TaxID=158019 RepID=A0A812BLG7_ACAPH|nr:SMAD3 [Sepia pharaonis]